MTFAATTSSTRRIKREGTSTPPSPPDGFPDIMIPNGAASLTLSWTPETGADGTLLYIATTAKTFPVKEDYTYRYKAAGASTATLTINGIAAGTYSIRAASYVGSVVRELSHEITKVAT